MFKKNYKYEILNHIYFYSKIRFFGDSFRAFQPVLFLIFYCQSTMVTNTFTQLPPSSHHHHHQRHHHYKKASYSPASLLKIFQFLKISWNSEQSLLSINLCKIFELWESCFLFHIFSLHIQDQYYILKIGKQCVSRFWLSFCYFMPELVLSMLRELPGGWVYFV